MDKVVIEAIRRYLCRQFVDNPVYLPDDECLSEVEDILNLDYPNGNPMLAICNPDGSIDGYMKIVKGGEAKPEAIKLEENS